MHKDVEVLVQGLSKEDQVKAQQMEKDAKGLSTSMLCMSLDTFPNYVVSGEQYRVSERLYFCIRGIVEMDEIIGRCEAGEDDGSVGNFVEAKARILARAKELRVKLLGILPKLIERSK